MKSWSNPKLLVLALALANAILFCCLLPLWEGFDEPFHYAYVQSLSVDHRIPILRHSYISSEIYHSLLETPLSHILSRDVPGTISFEDWFALSSAERREREQAIANLSPQLQQRASPLLNYEAQQTPLAYLLLAPLDAALHNLSLRSRILILRLIVTVPATLLLFFACDLLCDGLGLTGPFKLATLAALFETEIVWAAVAHVANDWLAILAAAWFFAILVQLVGSSGTRNALALAGLLACGLLAKAYFLAFVPIFAAILIYQWLGRRISARTFSSSLLIPIVVAGPWYLRNIMVYKSLTGMQEVVGGVGSSRMLFAFTHIDWPASIISSARWSLWTGNESHLAFSKHTLDCELVLLVVALILLFVRYKRIGVAEYWVLAGVGAFIASLFYDLCVAWADTHGVQTSTGPYYAPCVLPAIFALAYLGLQRASTAGRVIAAAISVVAAWIAALTYVAKLFPLYGGFFGRSTLPALWAWWTANPRMALSGLALAPFSALIALLICFLVLLIAFTILLLIQFKNAFAVPQSQL